MLLIAMDQFLNVGVLICLALVDSLEKLALLVEGDVEGVDFVVEVRVGLLANSQVVLAKDIAKVILFFPVA